MVASKAGNTLFMLLDRFCLKSIQTEQNTNCTNTNWAGSNPLGIIRLFFALTAQAKATSLSHFVSPCTLRKIFVKNWSWLSHKPFLHGLYKALVVVLILNFSHIL